MGNAIFKAARQTVKWEWRHGKQESLKEEGHMENVINEESDWDGVVDAVLVVPISQCDCMTVMKLLNGWECIKWNDQSEDAGRDLCAGLLLTARWKMSDDWRDQLASCEEMLREVIGGPP